MTKIKEFNRTTVRNLNDELSQDLAQLAKKWGIQLEVKNARFNSTSVSIKLEASVIQGGQALTPAATDWDRYAPLHGLGDYQVGDRLEIGGKLYTISGWNRKAPKYPVKISKGGKTYRATVNHVKSGTKIS
jgi:hypothetical protein